MNRLIYLIKSFAYAGKGIVDLFRNQQNAWIHLLAGTTAIILGFVFSINMYEWIAIMIVIGFVFASETFNSAIEMLGNKVSPDYDPAMAKIKDMAAAGVLISAISALLTGLIIFVPKVL